MSNKTGSKIEEVRQSRGLTIEQLSERTGLSTEQISRIEKNEIMPSLAPLIKIARTLGVRLGTFLDDHEELGPIINKAGSLKKDIVFGNIQKNNESLLHYFSLAGNKAPRHMEPFLVDIEPQMNNPYTLSTHEGEEFIYVLEGSIEIEYGKAKYILEKGDSIYYDSIVPHHVHSPEGKKSQIIGVVYIPV
jgi:transcriptional regulator with XRE-family HTH domain